MNKRLLTIILASIMSVSAGASVFADNAVPVNNSDTLLIAQKPEEITIENEQITQVGTYLIYDVIVDDIKDNTIIAKVNGEETHFKTNESTIFNSKTKDIPTQGDALKIVVDGEAPAPAILPAQYTAAAVLRTEENVYVGSFKTTDEGFVSEDNTLALELEGTDFDATELEGKDVVVLYGASTRSIPAITSPSQIFVLNTQTEEVEEDVEEDVKDEVENGVNEPCYTQSNYLVFDAIVEEIEDNAVVTTVGEQTMVFNIFEETLFSSKTRDMLQKGDNVKFVVDGNAPTTYQLPVTYGAAAVVKTDENVFVGEFKLRDNKLVSCNNTLALNLEGTDFTAKELKNNDLIVIYGNSTRSIPAITTPSQIIALRDNDKSFKDFLKETVQAAKSVVDIYVNRIKIDFSKYDNVLPIIEDDFTLVPLRAVAEALDCNVDFDDATKTVTITNDDKVITLVLNAKTAKVNDKELALDKEAKVINDRTMVPARFISESLGYFVDWDADSRSVVID